MKIDIFDDIKTYHDDIKSVLETIYFISATFVPIILGVITYKFSKEVNKRDKYQLKLLKDSNQLNPKIIVKTREAWGEAKLHEELYIINERHVPLKTAEVNYQTFLELVVSNEYKKIIIPVYGYYGNQSGNLLQGDTIFIFPHNENRKFFGDLYREFGQINLKEKPVINVNPEIKTCIKIEYTNIHDEEYTEYYLTDAFGYIKLNEQENVKLQQKLSAKKEEFYSLKAKELWDRFIQQNNLI